jgi:C1A family cysteine protease
MKHTSIQTLALYFLLLISFGCEVDTLTPSEPANTNRKTGWQGSDDPTTIPENLNNPFDGDPNSLPASVDLSQYLPPVGDQGQFGTCVAWATAYNCKTALEAIKFNLSPSQLQNPAYQLSPRYLFTALPDDKKGADCNGSDFTPAMELMLSQGVATKAAVPYQNLGNCAQNLKDPAWDADAAKHKIKYYRRIDTDVTTIKQALAAKMPVVLGAKLDDSFMSWNSDAVYQSATSTDQVGIHAYHAMCIVGYDNNRGPRGAFKVVNSWSNQWGSSGFIWVDYNFMVNGFSFNNNFFVAVNDEQKPDDNGNPNPPSSGVDIIPWVLEDFRNFSLGNTGREMYFNIYNVGNQAAPASADWGYAYLYYNAYDANDYGVIFYDRLNDTQGPYKSIFQYDDPSSGLTGLVINSNIPAGGSLGMELFEADTLSRTYFMPNNLNGMYYLVVFGDATDKFTSESDESNNLFYTTSQEPIFFENGVGDKRNGLNDRFLNPLGSKGIQSNAADGFRTAVNASHRNAYTPEEIIGFLKKEVHNGKLAAKIAKMRPRSGSGILSTTRKGRKK